MYICVFRVCVELQCETYGEKYFLVKHRHGEEWVTENEAVERGMDWSVAKFAERSPEYVKIFFLSFVHCSNVICAALPDNCFSFCTDCTTTLTESRKNVSILDVVSLSIWSISSAPNLLGLRLKT